jgi:hypothetical protein
MQISENNKKETRNMKLRITLISLMLLVVEPAIGADYDITINLRGGNNCPSYVAVRTLCQLNNINQADLACPPRTDQVVFRLTGQPGNDVTISWPEIPSADPKPLTDCQSGSSGNRGANRTISCTYNTAFPLNTVAKYTVQYTNGAGVQCYLDPRIIITDTQVNL